MRSEGSTQTKRIAHLLFTSQIAWYTLAQHSNAKNFHLPLRLLSLHTTKMPPTTHPIPYRISQLLVSLLYLVILSWAWANNGYWRYVTEPIILGSTTLPILLHDVHLTSNPISIPYPRLSSHPKLTPSPPTNRSNNLDPNRHPRLLPPGDTLPCRNQHLAHRRLELQARRIWQDRGGDSGDCRVGSDRGGDAEAEGQGFQAFVR